MASPAFRPVRASRLGAARAALLFRPGAAAGGQPSGGVLAARAAGGARHRGGSTGLYLTGSYQAAEHHDLIHAAVHLQILGGLPAELGGHRHRPPSADVRAPGRARPGRWPRKRRSAAHSRRPGLLPGDHRRVRDRGCDDGFPKPLTGDAVQAAVGLSTDATRSGPPRWRRPRVARIRCAAGTPARGRSSRVERPVGLGPFACLQQVKVRLTGSRSGINVSIVIDTRGIESIAEHDG